MFNPCLVQKHSNCARLETQEWSIWQAVEEDGWHGVAGHGYHKGTVKIYIMTYCAVMHARVTRKLLGPSRICVRRITIGCSAIRKRKRVLRKYRWNFAIVFAFSAMLKEYANEWFGQRIANCRYRPSAMNHVCLGFLKRSERSVTHEEFTDWYCRGAHIRLVKWTKSSPRVLQLHKITGTFSKRLPFWKCTRSFLLCVHFVLQISFHPSVEYSVQCTSVQ